MKSAMVMVPALDAQPDDEEQDRDREPDAGSPSAARPAPASGSAWIRSPKSRSKTPSAFSRQRLLQAVGAGHADARQALGHLGGHRRHLGLGALGQPPQPAADAVDRDERRGEDQAACRGSAASRWSSITAKVTTMVRMPVTPPRMRAHRRVPTSPMSEEKRAASPAGASVCSRARSVPTSRANIVLRRSVSMRVVTRLPVISLVVLADGVGAGQRRSPRAAPTTSPTARALWKAAITSWISLE